MAQRAIFLDRDRTIIDYDDYLSDPAKVKLMPGAAAALASLRALGYRLIVVSNQSGVARGMFTEADVEAVNDEMGRQLRKQAGSFIDASYYCPFHVEGTVAAYRVDHDWRKPRPGMLKQAAADFHLDLTQCWMIGDQWSDIAAGAAAGCRTILLHDPGRFPGGDSDENRKMLATVSPCFVVRSLSDAARIIAREGPAPPPAPPAPPEPPAPPVVPPPPAPPVAPPPPVVDADDLATRIAEKLASHMPPPPPPPPAPPAPLPVASPVAPVAAPAPDAAAALPPHPATLEQRLDELVVELRQQNRRATLHPDFSLAHIFVLIAQGFALVTMAIGFFKYFTIPATYKAPQDLEFAQMAHLQALIWIFTAVFFQCVVLALLAYARQK